MSFFLSDETPGKAYPHGGGTILPLVVEAPNKPQVLVHGLGRVPRAAFVCRADQAVDFFPSDMDRERAVGTFDAGPALVAVKFE